MTKRNQRISIWIITIILGLGTLGSFLVVALEYKNYNDQVAAYQKLLTEQKKAAQTTADNSEALSGYSADTFDSSSVNKLNVEVLTPGTGKTVQKTDKVKVSYFGWMPDGTIFDSTTKKGKSDSPIEMALDGFVAGWQDGLAGQNVGSTVRLTIPADKAYGSTGSGIIPANTPLKFIITIHEVV